MITTQWVWVVFPLCRAVADADEDEADGQQEEPAAQADSLERPEAAPFPHSDAVYGADPEQDQAGDSRNEDAQLSFRYHRWIYSFPFPLPARDRFKGEGAEREEMEGLDELPDFS